MSKRLETPDPMAGLICAVHGLQSVVCGCELEPDEPAPEAARQGEAPPAPAAICPVHRLQHAVCGCVPEAPNRGGEAEGVR